MKTITIGQCKTSGSWTTYYDPYPDTHGALYISQNSESYRIHNLLLGFNMLLAKDTFTASHLTELLSKEVINHDEVWKYVNGLILGRITVDEYIESVNETLQKVEHVAFRKGTNYIRKELKELLDIK